MRAQRYATTPAQSKRLLEAGIDKKTADLSMEPFFAGDYADPHPLPDVYETFPDDVSTDIAMPSWSVSALSDFLVRETTGTLVVKAARWGISVELRWLTLYADDECIDGVEAGTLIDAMVELTVRYLNEYRKGMKI